MDLASKRQEVSSEPISGASRLRRARNFRKALWMIGYVYSLSLFLFACALALSVQGVAFSSLHLKLKAQLNPRESQAQISPNRSQRESGSRPIGAR